MNLDSKIILCVDDDQDDLFVLREALNKIDTNHDIVEAFDGLHALELLNKMKREGSLPCLIVLDINMPRMDGKQTLVALQRDKDFSKIPVVLFSTSSSLLDKAFSETRQVELITKPIEVNALYKAASKILSYCQA